MSIDLFANGNDYSPATIEEGRNVYYQQQLSQQIEREMTELKSELSEWNKSSFKSQSIISSSIIQPWLFLF